MKIHHRNYPYRPPYSGKDRTRGPVRLFFSFARKYLGPFRKMILACIILSALDYAASFYLLAYYSKVVIDSIIVVAPPGSTGAPPAGTAEASVTGLERARESKTVLGAVRRNMETTSAIGLRQQRPPGAKGRLWKIFVLYIATLVIGNMLTRLAGWIRINVGQRLTRRLREDMHAQVLRLSVGYHSVHTPGRLLARIITDTGAVQDLALKIFINGTSQLSIITIGFVMLTIINWQMMIIVALSLPFYVLIYKVANPVMRRMQREMSHTNACMWGLVSQKIDAIRMIQACNREKREELNFHRLAACHLRDSLVQNRVNAAADSLGACLSGLTSGVVVFLFGMHQVLNNSMTLGEMMYAWGTANALFGPILHVSGLNASFVHLLVYLRRLAEVMEEPVRIADANDAVALDAPLKSGIVLESISFGYDAEKDPVLKDVSLRVPAGAWVCIMGASGCGKTTLLYLIDRLYEPDSGAILFDGIPLRRIKISSLRDRITLVPQEAQIISGTVRDNICYGRPEASPAQIIAAAKAAEFHDFIMTLPAKYEAMLGEKGMTLSGGQKQRLSLARALLSDPDVLLLDDCTSALDAETERKIQDTLEKIMAGKTAVVVSQRISMAKRCQRIYVLEKGAVAEEGTHAELVARNGFYARLNAKQTE